MLHALAAIAGTHDGSDSTVVDQPQLHRRRQLTLQEDIIPLNGQPLHISQVFNDAQQQSQQPVLALECHVNQVLVRTRSDLERSTAQIELKMQMRLEESYRTAVALNPSNVSEAVQAINVQVDTAEASLVEARARLDEALDIHVANSQLLAPENILHEVAQICDEKVQQALGLAQQSFIAAVEEKAEKHASKLEARLREYVDQHCTAALSSFAGHASDHEARVQAKLEALLVAAYSQTSSGMASLESKLNEKFAELDTKVDRAVNTKFDAHVELLGRKMNDRLSDSLDILAGTRKEEILSAVKEQARITTAGLVKAEMASQLHTWKSSDAKLYDELEAKLHKLESSRQLHSAQMEGRVRLALSRIQENSENAAREEVTRELSAQIQNFEQQLQEHEARHLRPFKESHSTFKSSSGPARF